MSPAFTGLFAGFPRRRWVRRESHHVYVRDAGFEELFADYAEARRS